MLCRQNLDRSVKEGKCGKKQNEPLVHGHCLFPVPLCLSAHHLFCRCHRYCGFLFSFLSQPSPFLYLGQISPLRNFLQPFYRISLNIHFSAVPDGISISSGCSPSSCLRHLPTFHLSTTFSVQKYEASHFWISDSLPFPLFPVRSVSL